MNLNKKGTVEDAVSKYLKTLEFKKKISNEKTRTQYDYQLRRLIATPLDDGTIAGDFPISKLNVA